MRRLAAIALLLLAGCSAVADQPVTAPAPHPQAMVPHPPQAPWIDVHMHLVAGRGSQQDFPGAVAAALGEMDRFGIAVALILPTPQVDTQQTYDAYAYAGALRRPRFAHLGGGGTLNATLHRYADPAQVTEAVRRSFAADAEKIIDAGALGFGEIAGLHLSATEGHPYEYVPVDHPLFRVLADVAARRDVPIDLHMDGIDGGMPTPPNFAVPPNPPKLPDTIGALERLLAHNRGARIVWAHGGSDPFGGMTPARIRRLMDTHPNLFMSLRVVGPQAPARNKLFAGGGLDPAWHELLVAHAGRFVIGTDSFMVAASMRGAGPGVTFSQRNTPKLEATVHALSLLPPDVARKVGRDNAIRIYKLTIK
ncbi:MAG: amidohydrolase family protein [Candidatus Rokubacteria bacterium]|nr:amidohydrolase family protein [Candidatus Rokubacteria bacterium]